MNNSILVINPAVNPNRQLIKLTECWSKKDVPEILHTLATLLNNKTGRE